MTGLSSHSDRTDDEKVRDGGIGPYEVWSGGRTPGHTRLLCLDRVHSVDLAVVIVVWVTIRWVWRCRTAVMMLY